MSNPKKEKKEMKKILLSMGLMLAALTLTNCSNEIDENINANTDGANFELTADIDTDRATTNGYNIKWEKGDALNLYHAVAGTTTYTNDAKFAIDETDITAGRFTGKLGGELTAEAYDWYAFYPYDSYLAAPTGANYTTLWAQNQTALDTDDQSHISKANNPLYGVAKGVSATAPLAITMRPLGTMLKINLINVSDEDLEVSSVDFATTSCKITGSYKVNFTGTTPVVTKSGDNYTYNNVNLKFSCGTVLAEAHNIAGDCQVFAAVAPFTAPAGEVLTITVATNKGNVEVKKTLSAATEFKPGVVNTINVEIEATNAVEYEYVKVTNFSTLSAGDEVVFAATLSGKTGVLKQNGTSTGPSFYTTNIAIVGNTIEGITNDFVYVVGGDATNGYTFTQNGKYLYATNTNNGVRFGTTSTSRWTITANNDAAKSHTVKVNTSSVRWLTIYNSQDWRVYTSANSTATNTDDILFFVKQVKVDDGKEDQTLTFSTNAITLNDVDINTFEEPELSGANTTVAYTSSNTNVATVDASTGEVTIVEGGIGTTTISAEAAESDTWNMAAASYTITVKQTIIPEVSATEFNAAKVDANKLYSLSGIIKNVKDTNYGNFDLYDDASNKVYVYGLYSPDGKTDRYWTTAGVKEGDYLTVHANRGEYNGSAQAVNARYVSHYGIKVTVPTTSVAAAGGSVEIPIELPSEVTDGTLDFTKVSGVADVTLGANSITVTYPENTGNTARDTSIKLTYGNVYTTFTVSQATDAVSATESMSIYANKGTLASDKLSISWTSTSGNFTVTNNKASSSSAIRVTDSDHHRVYAKSNLVVTANNGKKFTQVKITCTTSAYATVLKNAISGATVSGSVVTVNCTTPVSEVKSNNVSEQTRINKVEVTFE